MIHTNGSKLRIRCAKLSFVVLLFVLIFAMVPAQACAESTSGRQQTVRVGYFIANNYQDIGDDGLHSGYGYTYLQKIAEYTGWDYEYVTGSWSDCVRMLKNGEIDLLTYAEYTPEREEIFEYSSLSMGYSYGTLTTRADDDHYSLEDYESFDGMTVGEIADNIHNAQFATYCEENGIDYRVEFYEDFPALFDALADGEVDGVVASNHTNPPGSKVVARFALKPYYAIVAKGNDELMAQVNEALTSIRMDDPCFEENLYDEYYLSEGSTAGLALSAEEKRYLKSKGVLRVVASDDSAPLSYFDEETGTYQGAAPEIMRRIAESLGVELRYIEVDSYADALAKVSSDEADLICDFSDDSTAAETFGVRMCAPYTMLQYSAVVRREYKVETAENTTVAVVSGDLAVKRYVTTNYASWNIAFYDTIDECLDAVSDGTQDITFVNNYQVEYALSDFSFYNLTPDLSVGFSAPVGIGVALDSATLGHILDKETNALGTDDVSLIIAEQTVQPGGTFVLLSFIYDHPLQIVSVILLLAIVLVLVAMRSARRRNRDAEHLFNLAFVDNLTGLYNGVWFEEHADELLASYAGSEVCALTFTIDRIGVINDYYGKAVGDEITIYIATTLVELAGTENSTLVRINKNHFLGIMPYSNQKNLEARIRRIREKYHVYRTGDETITITLNIGACRVADFGMDLCAAADAAELACKEARKAPGTTVYIDAETQDRLRREKMLEDRMERALENHEFVVFYQPKFNMFTNEMIGAEALVRWYDENGKMLPPDVFIPLFERNGFVIQLDSYVLEEVCRMLRGRFDAGMQIVPVSVNQSQVHLADDGYVDRLRDIISRYDLPVDTIELELTETAVVDVKDVDEIFAQIKELGLRIAVDDFGSGNTSIRAIDELPIDSLKLDRSLLTRLLDSSRARAVIESTISMAKTLGMSVICEGIETVEQAGLMMDLGCSYAQGYLYARPVPLSDFEDLMDDLEA